MAVYERNPNTGVETTVAGIQDLSVYESRISDIEDVIPSDATSSNQLVTESDLGTAAAKDFTDTVRPNSHDLVESNAVYSAINNAVSSIYTPRGDLTCAELTSSLLIDANVGNVYEMSDAGTTTALFIQGAGETIGIGDNVGIIKAGSNTYLFNLMGNAFDLTDYQKKDLASAIEGATTVEGALGALSTNSQATQAEVNDIVNVYGAKNLIPYPYHRQNGYTTNGATFTYDDEGVITVNKVVGNSTAYFALFSNILYPNAEKFLKPNTSYILSMELEDATSTSCFLQTQNGIDIAAIRNKATGKYETLFTTTETIDSLTLGLYYGAETAENNAKVKLMIRLASIQDDTYEPYSKTNRELTIDKVEQEEVNDIVNVYGAKNLLPYPYYSTTKTVSGITITDNGDGTLTLDGTATARITYEMTATASYNLLEIGKKYLIGFKTSDDTIDSNSWALRIYCKKDSTTVLSTTDSRGSDVAFTVPEETVGANVQFIIVSGTVLNNVVIKPMIRLASIQDDTWVPYVPTNKELMSCKLNGYVGAKNLNSYPYTNTSYVSNGITWTDNGDGTITANGTATADSYFGCHQRGVNTNNQLIIPNGTYIASGCPDTGSGTTYEIRIERTYNNAVNNLAFVRTMAGKVFTANGDDSFNDHVRLQINLVIRSGATVSNLTFKPMIRRVEDTDPTWQPYAKTNRELTKVVTNQLGDATLAGTYLSDCNDVASSGTLNLYAAISSTANSPYTTGVETSANSFVILSRVDTNTNWGMQLAIPMTSVKGIYMRFKASGTWGTWSKITP